MADSCDAVLGEHARGGRDATHHDVQWQRRCFGQAADRRDFLQAWRKETVRSRLCIGARPFDRFPKHFLFIPAGWVLKEHIGSGVEEESDPGCVCDLPGVPNPRALIVYLAQGSTRGEAVLKIASNGSRLYRQGYVPAYFLRGDTVAAFQVHSYRQVYHGDDASQVGDRQSVAAK
jgi:hypothetical protein